MLGQREKTKRGGAASAVIERGRASPSNLPVIVIHPIGNRKQIEPERSAGADQPTTHSP